MIRDTEQRALLVMDVQNGIIGRLPNKDDYIADVQKAIDAAHKKDIPVIFIVVGFREGVPEIGPYNKFFSGMKDRIDELVDPKPSIAPQGNDIVVTKRRFSAFSGSDLEVILRAHKIGELVLCGVATSGVILSTTREAADKDYSITILSDLCADGDEEVNRVLLEKILPRQANISTCEEWTTSLP